MFTRRFSTAFCSNKVFFHAAFVAFFSSFLSPFLNVFLSDFFLCLFCFNYFAVILTI